MCARSANFSQGKHINHAKDMPGERIYNACSVDVTFATTLVIRCL